MLKVVSKTLACWNEKRLPYRLAQLVENLSSRCERAIAAKVLRRYAHGNPTAIDRDTAWELHRGYPCRDGYGYDWASLVRRAESRCRGLNDILGTGRSKVLDVGAGDGVLALKLVKRGVDAATLDAADWRRPEVRDAGIPHHMLAVDGRYELPDASFDVVVSFNTMEHISDPGQALKEMVRVCRPGGRMFLSFGPLYNSPWGLHAYRTFHAPYAQFLLSDGVLQEFIDSVGIADLGTERESFQYVNQWSLRQYRDLMAASADLVSVDSFSEKRDYSHLSIVRKFPHAFAGRQLTVAELCTHSLEVQLTVR